MARFGRRQLPSVWAMVELPLILVPICTAVLAYMAVLVQAAMAPGGQAATEVDQAIPLPRAAMQHRKCDPRRLQCLGDG